MKKSEIETDGPFPSVRVYKIWIPGNGPYLTLSGSEKLIESYLNRFGCVPVFDKEISDLEGGPPSFNLELFRSKKFGKGVKWGSSLGMTINTEILSCYPKSITVSRIPFPRKYTRRHLRCDREMVESEYDD